MREPVTVIAESDFPPFAAAVARAISAGFDELVGRLCRSWALTFDVALGLVVATGVPPEVTGTAAPIAGVAEAAIKRAPV